MSAKKTRKTLLAELDVLPGYARVSMATPQAITGKSRSTIYRMIKDGRFPAPEKSGQLYWTVDSLRQWLAGGAA